LYQNQSMEKRINHKIEHYITTFKDSIRDKTSQIGIEEEKMNTLLQYIYEYERLVIQKEDFSKRKRVKNVVPFFERCCAKRANNEQCTRRKKKEDQFCGTHIKNKPHGIMEENNENSSSISMQKIEVWTQDIQGILYYIDKYRNVYLAEDIILNKQNPKIIAKYILTGDVYTIPEFGI